jgi:hypothetical protein
LDGGATCGFRLIQKFNRSLTNEVPFRKPTNEGLPIKDRHAHQRQPRDFIP